MKHSLFGKFLLISIAYLSWQQAGFAESLFVTDRIMLGVHQEAESNSTLLTSIPSGTTVDVQDTSGEFTKVKLANGTEGWVLSSYLLKEKPAVAELDELSAKYQNANEQARKSEKEAQLWRDELSNAKNQIKNLRKQMAKGESFAATEALEKDLAKEKAKSSELEAKIVELEANLAQLKALSQEDTVAKLQQTLGENQNLQARITAALANLEGKTVPTAEELAAIRPDFPVWYSGLLFLMVIIGVGAGIGWMDYQNRKKHGGFRL